MNISKGCVNKACFIQRLVLLKFTQRQKRQKIRVWGNIIKPHMIPIQKDNMVACMCLLSWKVYEAFMTQHQMEIPICLHLIHGLSSESFHVKYDTGFCWYIPCICILWSVRWLYLLETNCCYDKLYLCVCVYSFQRLYQSFTKRYKFFTKVLKPFKHLYCIERTYKANMQPYFLIILWLLFCHNFCNNSFI